MLALNPGGLDTQELDFQYYKVTKKTNFAARRQVKIVSKWSAAGQRIMIRLPNQGDAAQ